MASEILTAEVRRRSSDRWCRFIALAVLLVVGSWLINVVPAAHGDGAPVSLTPEERAWLQAHPVIRLAPDPEFRPIEFFDQNGLYHGLAADHVRLLEQRLGIRFTIVRLKNWDEVMGRFQRRQVDLLGAIVPTPQRRNFMLFTDPLIEVPGGIFIRKGSPRTLTLNDLKGMRVAVVSNYTAHDFLLAQHPRILLDVVPDTATGLSKVSFGIDDAYVENMATAVYYLQRQGISNLRLAGRTDFSYRWGMGVRHDWPLLQSILNKGLAAISKEEKRAILNRWIYVEGKGWQPSPVQLAMAVVVFLLLGLVAVILWNRSLRQQVAEQTIELQHTIRELEGFCYSVSHDLRAPLRHINSYSAIISEEYGTSLDRDGQELLQRIKLASNRMGQLIDDLLGLTRTARAEMNMVEVDLTAICQELGNELRQGDPDRQARFIIADGLGAKADPMLVRVVLQNLLDNAWKYTSKRQTATIEVGSLDKEGEMVFFVRDDGAGFDMAYANKLFMPFQRLHRDQDFPGTGIGLATVQRIILRHGGRIWVEAALGEGATFFFTLP